MQLSYGGFNCTQPLSLSAVVTRKELDGILKWTEMCKWHLFYLIFNQCWVVDSSLVERVRCKSSLLSRHAAFLMRPIKCNHGEVACPNGYARHTPTMTVVGSCCLLLFCYTCDCTLPTRNKKNVTLKEKMTPMDPGFDITVEGLQAAIFLGNFLAFS